jgi:RNA polymerase sigma factor (sigma-70 family)
LSLAGDGRAFRAIVVRYQSLLCSLAYSATGNLGASEDVAQETFVAAWRQLRDLREPARLRSWLCGIARNLTFDAARQQRREPTYAAESIEVAAASPTDELRPSEQIASQEEAALLWQAVEHIPEIYREPLILFYRQQQSVAKVATALELSEDVVKQRLSRGRKMLHEKVVAFVEGTLGRTNPGEKFTQAVLSAVPLGGISSLTAGGAAGAKGAGFATTTAGFGWVGMFFAPIAGIVAGLVGTKIGIDRARSARERRWAVQWAWLTWGLVGAVYLAFGVALTWPGANRPSPWITGAVIAGMLAAVLCFLSLALWSRRRRQKIRTEDMVLQPPSPGPHGPACEYRSVVTFLGLPLVHVRSNCWENGKILPARGWIAFGDVAYGVLFASGGRAGGLVALGGVALGGVAIGGCSFGVLAYGGIALGGWALGATAVGYEASGAAALAWHGAAGGAAMAREFAIGPTAWARHANDPAAREFIFAAVFFRNLILLMNACVLLSWLALGGWKGCRDRLRAFTIAK